MQDRVEATGRVEEATGKVEGTSPWARLRDHQITQSATGVAHSSTRAQTAPVTLGTGSKEGTSRVVTSRGSREPSKGDSARVEEVDTNDSKGSRAGRGPWSGCSSLHRATGSQ